MLYCNRITCLKSICYEVIQTLNANSGIKMMLRWLKKDKSLTLLETVVAMLIISSSAAGILGSFSYAFKFVYRAGKKTEAANINRKVVEMYRALSIVNEAGDTRLDLTPPPPNEWMEITLNPPFLVDVDGDTAVDYDEKIYKNIKNWPNDAAPTGKQIDIKVNWTAP